MKRKHPLAECEVCPLKEQPYVPSLITGTDDPIVVGEAPGGKEVEVGLPFVGPSGQLLDRVISQLGQDPRRLSRTNIVSCRPPGNRDPAPEEAAACRPRLLDELRSHPGVVVAAGKVAREALLGKGASNAVLVHSDELRKEVLPIWHPAYVLRKPSAFEEFRRGVARAYRNGGQPYLDVEVRVLDAVHTLEPVLRGLVGTAMAYDFEATSVDWVTAKPLCLALTNKVDHAYIIPDDLLQEAACLEILRDFFTNEETSFTAHHGKWDLHLLWKLLGEGVGRVDFDTLVAHYALIEHPPHGLKTLLSWYFDYGDYQRELIGRHLKRGAKNYADVPRPDLYRYTAIDVVGTLRLRRQFESDLSRTNLPTKLFTEVLMPLTMVFARMEHRGIAVDVPHLGFWDGKMKVEVDVLASEIRNMAGKPDLNPNSTQQMAVVLWDEMHLKKNPRNKNYRKTLRSTAIPAVEHLASINPKSRKKVRDGEPIVDTLVEYRRVAKLKSTYVDNLLESAASGVGNGRVHGTYNVHGTEIGRPSFQNPNLGNIPRPEDKWGRAIRSSFIAGDGKLLVGLDYAQAEWRVFAAECEDPWLVAQFSNGVDLHSSIAKEMYGEEFTETHRGIAKSFNYAWIYGGTEWSFASDAGMPLDRAREWVRRYNSIMPVAVQWRREQFHRARTNGFVSTRTGRLRRFPLITKANLADTRKAAVHAVVSGGASDLTLMSLIDLDKITTPVLTVYDSITLEVDQGDAENVAAYAKDIMLSYGREYYPEVPWEVDVHIGKRWVETPNEQPAL